MKKRWCSFFLCLCLCFVLSVPAIAEGTGNMEGEGGGNMEGATGASVWNDGQEGVRVSVIDKKTKKAVGTIVDLINFLPPDNILSFVKHTKLQYLSGASLAPLSGKYICNNPAVALPNTISPNGSSNIAELKAYFCDKGIVTEIAKHVSIKYDTLVSGKFTIIIEPLAIFKYNGIDYAMTATEAALYDRMVDGSLKSVLGNLTHQNQPLSMYLEVAELGIAPGGGSGIQPNDYIISTLGIGTVNFGDVEEAPPETPEPVTYDYIYRGNTNVITTIKVETASDITPDDPGKATFTFPNNTLSKEYVVPADESQLVWVRWTTPNVDTETHYKVPVTVTKGTGGGTVNILVTPAQENTPPDPQGRDRNDEFSLKPHAEDLRTEKLIWGEWTADWEEDWVQVSDGCSSSCPDGCTRDHYSWEDDGEWGFDWSEYKAGLVVNVKTMPDERVKTARKDDFYSDNWTMKSAYGINAEVSVSMLADGTKYDVTPVQNVIAVFPEFDYETYDRWLVSDLTMMYVGKWHFAENEYSQFKNPVHFTPVWYPDLTSYPVTFYVHDAWTPVGEMTFVLTASNITINGSAYDDWHSIMSPRNQTRKWQFIMTPDRIENRKRGVEKWGNESSQQSTKRSWLSRCCRRKCISAK